MTENDNRLFLLDAYALIFRSYYAFIKNPRVTSKGMNTSAVFGFLLTLEDLLTRQKPTHIAVVFDPPGPTFRNEIYPAYKANRDATPEDIKISVPYIKRLLDAYRIPVIEVPGFEADDVIGTLARKAAEEGYTAFMMTPDKDFAQLVTDRVVMYRPGRGGGEAEIWGVKEIIREYGVAPGNITDLLGLMGDSSDNIPGAPGIGPKTACKLISEHGSIETLLGRTAEISGRQKDILEQNREQILLSKRLATIEQDVPVEFRHEELHRHEIDTAALRRLYEELEFRTLASRLPAAGEGEIHPASGELQSPAADTHAGQPGQGLSSGRQVPDDGLFASRQEPGEGIFASRQQQAANQQGTLFGSAGTGTTLATINTTPHNYTLAETAAQAEELAARLAGLREFCFDTETTSLDPLNTQLVAIAFCWEKGSGTLQWLPPDRSEALKLLEPFRPLFENEKIRKTGQNLKFDMQVLSGYGISVKGTLFDTMIAHYLLEPDMRHNMDLLAAKYLNYEPVHIEELIGERGPRQRNMRDVDKDRVKEYAVEDADVTWQLKEIFEPALRKEGLDRLAADIEMPLISVLAAMEREGILIDESVLKNYAVTLRETIIGLEKEIYTLAGQEFNISSPKQLGEILFVRLRLDDKARLTKTRQYRTDEEVLQRLTAKHPVIGKVLEYRGLKKLLSTYVESLPELIDKRTGRIHTTYNQAVASTGRLSSTNPNLQNIPVRDAEGREIRKAFIPASGKIFLSADYSQIELRLMAHLSGDSTMIEDFLSGQDIHSATASKIFGVPVSDVTREMRAKAKTANFGIIYGISAFGLSERLNIGRKEAKELIDGYFSSYPGVKVYMDESIRRARESGYVTTMFGRRRYLPDIQSRNQVVRGNAERNAINAPLQGSAADIIKIAMVRIAARLEREIPEAKMILQVHDELIFEVDITSVERLRTMVTEELKGAADLRVPLEVDTGTGNNWLEAH
ncbi:MAG: DNA polymerase I [Bacteroidales bacterium]|nr:DNA polymerase I [Bacteroidales bacterium]